MRPGAPSPVGTWQDDDRAGLGRAGGRTFREELYGCVAGSGIPGRFGNTALDSKRQMNRMNNWLATSVLEADWVFDNSGSSTSSGEAAPSETGLSPRAMFGGLSARRAAK